MTRRRRLHLVPQPEQELTKLQVEMYTCVRCELLDPELVGLRSLWDTTYAAPLCDDCNGSVQGASFLDVLTGNRV